MPGAKAIFNSSVVAQLHRVNLALLFALNLGADRLMTAARRSDEERGRGRWEWGRRGAASHSGGGGSSLSDQSSSVGAMSEVATGGAATHSVDSCLCASAAAAPAASRAAPALASSAPC